jgi:FkbM family methyltransferase
MKKILIAIPTARYIEADTFKSIYDLHIPEGYDVHYQHFYGYRVDQVRNLICDWVVRGFDYLFSVDHDVTFPPDTLTKLLSHDKDLVAGVYRQRLEPQAIEIFDLNQRRMSIEDIYDKGLVQIGGCGFGCVLVKKSVIATIGYPQFEYHVALDHANTISEDTDFCKKAMHKGFQLWCDPSILCGHIGSTTMRVKVPDAPTIKTKTTLERFTELRSMKLLPSEHIDYLSLMKVNGVNPKVIYDIGSSVLHWYDQAQKIWPDALIIPFEAMEEVSQLYDAAGIKNYHLGLLSDVEKQVAFYQNLEHPGGNSVYRENSIFSPAADRLFPVDKAHSRMTTTLNRVCREKHLPLPNLIKLDVQGSEIDIIKGASEILGECTDIIMELQHVEYNKGAPTHTQAIQYMSEIGYVLVDRGLIGDSNMHSFDGDYHFKKAF